MKQTRLDWMNPVRRPALARRVLARRLDRIRERANPVYAPRRRWVPRTPLFLRQDRSARTSSVHLLGGSYVERVRQGPGRMGDSGFEPRLGALSSPDLCSGEFCSRV